MEESLFLAKALACKLIERRDPSVENELAKVCRKLAPRELLEIVIDIMDKNVRAAAAIAVRAQLPGPQQLELLELALATSQTNTIKVLVSELFAHRMNSEVFLKKLIERREVFPVGVHFAAYYFLGAALISSETREAIRGVVEETRQMR